MADLSPLSRNPSTHDVYFYVAGGPRLILRNPNHGIALDDAAIAWTSNGVVQRQSYANITAVHLQTAALGNAANVIDQCKIEFVDGSPVTISNASASGLPDKTQTPLYLDFVRDFHGRLAMHGSGTIRFTAGMAPWRYKMLFGALVVAGLLFIVTPLGLLMVTGDLHILIPMAMGISLCWPLTRLMMNNTPRDYTPRPAPRGAIVVMALSRIDATHCCRELAKCRKPTGSPFIARYPIRENLRPTPSWRRPR